MQKSAIKLTNHQLKLVSDPTYPLTKIEVMERLTTLLHACAAQLRENKLTVGNTQLFECEYKISKGENYKGLPYLVLDYPKINSKKFPILLRTMFWWGKYFSLNILIHDDVKIRIRDNSFYNTNLNDCKLLVSSNIWEQDLAKEDYMHLSKEAMLLKESDYLKISKTVPIESYNELIAYMRFYEDTIQHLEMVK
jgi:hypothetical protein